MDAWCGVGGPREWLGRHGDCAGSGSNKPGMLERAGDRVGTEVPGPAL